MNPSDEINNEMLTAYFDGELSQAEQLQVEQSLFGCPQGRRQLRQWAVLRQELQQWAEASADRGRLSGPDGASLGESRTDAGGSTSAVMQQLLAAFRDGSAKWSTAANVVNTGSGNAGSGADGVVAGVDGWRVSADSPAAGSRMEPSASVQAGLEGSGSSGAATARGTSANGDWTRAKDGWLSDFRHLTPRQRMRRWTWQLGAAVTAAAALLLTVWLNPWSATRIETAMGPMAGPLSGMLEEPAAEGLATMAAPPEAMRLDIAPMLAADSDTSLAEGMEAGSTGETPLESYTAFLVYDATDQTASLEALQTVLTQNALALTEIFHEDGNPAVVLSGDTRQLAEVLEAFQSQGEHQLAFVSKIDNAPALTFGSDLLAAGSSEVAPAPSSRMEMEARTMAADSLATGSLAAGSLAPLASDGMVAGSAAAPGAAPVAAAPVAAAPGLVADAAVAEGPLPDGGLAMKAWPQVDPRGVGGEVAADLPAGAAGTELPASVVNSQLRQDIIRSQANLLANSIAPPANLTLEEFLRERPSQRQPRVPFDPGWAVESEGPESEKMAADATESLEALGQSSAAGMPGSRFAAGQRPKSVADVAPQALSGGAVGDKPGYLRSGVGGRMGRLSDASGLESAVPGQSTRGLAATSGADAPRAEVMPVDSAAQSRSDGRWLNSQQPGGNSQIVVIIRGKRPTVPAGPESTRPTEPARGPQD